MSNKIVKSGSNKIRSAGTGTEIMEQIIEYILTILMIILCVVVPLYAKEGYRQIGNAKFAAYRGTMLTGGVILCVVSIPYLIFWLRDHRKLQVSVTDGFVLAYLILSGISVISGGFYEDALWGCHGWNMGLMSQISFVLLYLFLSRFGRYHRAILTVLCVVAGIVYTIGILHRLLIDPIGFYEGLSNSQKAQFLSTLGQASWYGSFLAVTLPLGIGVFLQTERKMWRVLTGIFMVLGFGTLVTQNSDSAYFALAGAMILFIMIAAQSREKMCRYMGVLALFFASGKIMSFLMRIRPNPELQVDFVTRLMWDSGVTWVLLTLCLMAVFILYIMDEKKRRWKYPADMMRRAGRMVPAAAIVLIACIVLVICLQVHGILPQAVSDKISNISYFNWNEDWGNGRGRIWKFSVKMFSKESTLHKFLGIGPDCFNSYVTARYNKQAARLWGEKQLTNAHNEWLNILINGGILGVTAYLGIYVTAIRRFYKNHSKDVLLAGLAAACTAYMCYNFFCYQQVLCTPFIFICMGIGEYILRQRITN